MTNTSLRPLSRSALLAAALLFATAPAALAKGTAKGSAAKGSSAKGNASSGHVPKADSAGVLEVFGVDGKEPAQHPDQGNPWKKTKQKIQGRTSDVDVTLAYTDVEGPKAEHRLFLNANPFTLPDGIYTYVILRDGTTSFGHPLDGWEIGTRHAHLAQGKHVVGSGELHKKKDSIHLNLLSGTFMIPMIKLHKVPNAKFLEGRITTWFDKVLRAHYKAPASFKVVFDTKGEGSYDNEIIFDNVLKPPTEEGLAKMCSYGHFKKNNEHLCSSGKGSGPGKGSGSAKAKGKKS